MYAVSNLSIKVHLKMLEMVHSIKKTVENMTLWYRNHDCEITKLKKITIE